MENLYSNEREEIFSRLSLYTLMITAFSRKIYHTVIFSSVLMNNKMNMLIFVCMYSESNYSKSKNFKFK